MQLPRHVLPPATKVSTALVLLLYSWEFRFHRLRQVKNLKNFFTYTKQRFPFSFTFLTCRSPSSPARVQLRRNFRPRSLYHGRRSFGTIGRSSSIKGSCSCGRRAGQPRRATHHATSPSTVGLDAAKQSIAQSNTETTLASSLPRSGDHHHHHHWRREGYGGEEAPAAGGAGDGAEAWRRRRGEGVGAAVEVGQDGVLRRHHDRVAAARLRAAGARCHTRPRAPVRAPLRAPPRRGGGVVRGGRRCPGEGVRLPVVARRPPRRLRHARAADTRRVHGVRRRRRGVLVGGGDERGGVGVLRAGQGRRRAPAPRRRAAGGEGPGAHAPAVAGARRHAPRRRVPDQLPRAPPPARLPDRRRGRQVKRRPSNTKGAEAV